MKYMTCRTAMFAVGLLICGGCDRDPTGPVELAPIYEVASADGAVVPVRSFRTVSNAGGTCVYDLVGGSLTFSNTTNYGLSFSYDALCDGNTTPQRVHDSTNGTYTRSDAEVSLTPRVHGTFTVERVQLQRGTATVDIRMNSGSTHRFQFVAVSFE